MISQTVKSLAYLYMIVFILVANKPQIKHDISFPSHDTYVISFYIIIRRDTYYSNQHHISVTLKIVSIIRKFNLNLLLSVR